MDNSPPNQNQGINSTLHTYKRLLISGNAKLEQCNIVVIQEPLILLGVLLQDERAIH